MQPGIWFQFDSESGGPYSYGVSLPPSPKDISGLSHGRVCHMKFQSVYGKGCVKLSQRSVLKQNHRPI